MNVFRIVVLGLAVVQLVITGFTAAVGAFADGGDVWQRLVLVVLHPACAVALLLLALPRSPVKVMALAVAGAAVGEPGPPTLRSRRRLPGAL